MASVRKSYISKFVNNRKLVPAVKFENFSADHKESIRKLVSLISANIFIKNNIYIWLSGLNLKKTPFRYYGFLVAIFWWDCG